MKMWDRSKAGCWLPSTIILLTSLICAEGKQPWRLTLYRPPPPTTGHNSQEVTHVVGGRHAKRGEFPYQVSIGFIGDDGLRVHQCGGAILDSTHILTAAHCFEDVYRFNTLMTTYDVVTSTTQLNSKISRRYIIKSVKIHEKFEYLDGNKTATNDIAIVTIKGRIKFDKNTKPLTLTRKPPKPGKKCTVSGWGLLNADDDNAPNELTTVTMPIISTKECQKSYKSSLGLTVRPTASICAGLKNGGQGFCNGDSGGPLTCNKAVAGIVSWSYGCAYKGFPDVYTNVYIYIPWIKKNLSKGRMRDEVEDDDNQYDEDEEQEDEEK